MRRIPIQPRNNWRSEVEKWGLLFHTTDEGATYWNESARYELSMVEVEEIESATTDLHSKCLEAVDWVITHKQYSRFGIPEAAIPMIEWTWETEQPTLYQRFDFVYDGTHPPKMLEYNADTPTSLLEAGVIQWKWLEAVAPDKDQFNSVWDVLVGQWKWLVEQRKLNGSLVHFSHADLLEDEMTIAILRDTAQEAGLTTEQLLMEEIGWDSGGKWFVDLNGIRIWTMFKLYPWEWIVKEEFGHYALTTMEETQWIEPLWKMILSNKAILPVLWELFPECPYLLPAFEDGPGGMTDYVRKPKLGREGANVTIFGADSTASDGAYGAEGFVYQQYARLPNFDGNRPIIGSWVIGDEPAGIGIRETDGLITDNLARFVPHWIE